MTETEAAALALFVKDHDTRYLPKAMGEGSEAYLQLTTKQGETLAPLKTVEDYKRQFIDGLEMNATIREAWAKWKP